MSKNEKIKEQIGWLKVVFGVLSAVLVSLMGWLATNYTTAESIVLVVATVLIVFISILIAFITKQAYKKMDELEEL